jgi:hypothetical protein
MKFFNFAGLSWQNRPHHVKIPIDKADAGYSPPPLRSGAAVDAALYAV